MKCSIFQPTLFNLTFIYIILLIVLSYKDVCKILFRSENRFHSYATLRNKQLHSPLLTISFMTWSICKNHPIELTRALRLRDARPIVMNSIRGAKTPGHTSLKGEANCFTFYCVRAVLLTCWAAFRINHPNRTSYGCDKQ